MNESLYLFWADAVATDKKSIAIII